VNNDNGNYKCIDKQGDIVPHTSLPSADSPAHISYLFSDDGSMLWVSGQLLQAMREQIGLLLGFVITL
jgi:hypothetical protein